MSSFEYTDEDGGRLTAKPLPGVPYVLLTTTPGGAAIPLDRLEEVIAGQRDMARQASGAAPFTPEELAVAQADVDALEAEFGPEPRRFYLHRHTDISGVSGTGVVADGVLWPDGTASLRWKGERPSTVHWDRIADAEAVHGHGGATEIVWLDEPPRCPAGLLPLGARAVEPCVIPAGAHDTHRTASGETWAAQDDGDEP